MLLIPVKHPIPDTHSPQEIAAYEAIWMRTATLQPVPEWQICLGSSSMIAPFKWQES